MALSLLLILAVLSQAPGQQPASEAPLDTPAQSHTQKPVRISTAVLDKLSVHKTETAYSLQAAQQHLQGMVVVRVVLDKSGKIEEATPMSGPDIFRQPAVDAVKKWQYKPFLLNGEAVQVESTVLVPFR